MQLGDNSPDGQTCNQAASISLPASSSPYPFNHPISLTHARRHLPHTWNYNYIFYFPTAAKQLGGQQFPQLINQNNRSLFIVKQPPPPKKKEKKKVSQLKTGKSGAKHSLRSCAFPVLCSSPPPGSLLPEHMTDTYHLFLHIQSALGRRGGVKIASSALLLAFHSYQLLESP